MANIDGLSSFELNNLKEGIDKIMMVLEKENKQLEFFFNHPFKFLKRFNISILEYVKTNTNLRNSFISAIRELIGTLRNILNRCLRCKLGVLFILFGILGKSLLLWGEIMAAIDKIKENLIEYFENTSPEMDKIIEDANRRIDLKRPSHLALLICENMGYCPA